MSIGRKRADKLLVAIPLKNPSIEVAAEPRALGGWHATQGRWQQAAARFASLVKVDQLDSREVTSLDQLRLAAALLEAGDRRSCEQWRHSVVIRFTPAVAPLPAPLSKACLLLLVESLLQEARGLISQVPLLQPSGAPR